MSFASIERNFCSGGEPCFPRRNAKLSETSAFAALPPWAATSNSVIVAHTKQSLIIPALWGVFSNGE
jgi:hypothetical protein